MTTTTLRLGRRDRQIKEPVFRQIRIIIAAYNQVADGDVSAQYAALNTILAVLTNNAVKLKQLNQTELTDFLAALPTICGLKPVEAGGVKRDTDWGHIYFHLAATLGWDYDYIDNHMTLSRLEECRAYLDKHPPTHQLVAAYLGYEQKNKDEGQQFLRGLFAQAKAQGMLQ